jgi:hypothetical protein
MTYKNVLIVVLIFIIAFINRCKQDTSLKTIQELKLQNQLLTDTVVHFKDANGKQSSKIRVLEVTNMNQIKNLDSQKNLVTLLQSEVALYKKKLQSSVGITTITEFDTIFKTDSFHLVTNSKDTISIQSFHFKHSDSWIKINIKGDSLNTQFSVKVDNQYSVSIVKAKKGFDAIVKNSNPYSTTTEILATKLSLPKPKKFGIGLVVGYGITFPLKPSPFIGVGLSYNIIRF